jgi:hypothetical protein
MGWRRRGVGGAIDWWGRGRPARGAVGWMEQGCQWVDGCHGHWPAPKARATLTEVSR